MPMSPRLLRPRASGGFTPKNISGLGLWLDASNTSSLTLNGNTVSEWRDLSGNGRHFSQATAANQPNATTRTQNGRRVLDFDGSTSRLVGNAATLNIARNISAMTIVAVGAFDVTTAPAGQGGRYLFFISRGDNATSARLAFGATAFSGGVPAGFQLFGRRNDSDSFQEVTSAPNTSPHVFTATANYAAALANLRIDGTSAATTNPWLTAGNTPNNDSLSVALAFDGASGNHVDGFIAELAVFQKALTVAEASALERYLGAKWGITLYSPPTYADSDVNAYITAVELADGQALETGVRDAINTFITGCKADGIWSAIKASCILMGARTLSGALTPLVGTAPTNNNFVSGDYNRKTGLLGNASTKFLNSNRDCNADPQNSFHLAAYASALPSINSDYAGDFASGNGNRLERFSSLAFGYARSANAINGGALAAGLYGVARSTSSALTARNGGVTSSSSFASVTPSSRNLCVFATNTASGAAAFTNARLAFYSIGESLTLATLDSRVSALYTAIGAAIP